MFELSIERSSSIRSVATNTITFTMATGDMGAIQQPHGSTQRGGDRVWAVRGS